MPGAEAVTGLTPTPITASAATSTPASPPDDTEPLPEYTKRRPLPAYTPAQAHEPTAGGRLKHAAGRVSSGLGKLVGFYFRGGWPAHEEGSTPPELRPKGHGVEVARARIREREELDRAAAAGHQLGEGGAGRPAS
ncbi:hypothetical protein Q8F55_001585 [Vanrija albida]|uniref:Uncharacterized protein n=1 Tax=Vanrija albida TaxID=181172 RepID=A0ABR3QGG8_9TREE